MRVRAKRRMCVHVYRCIVLGTGVFDHLAGFQREAIQRTNPRGLEQTRAQAAPLPTKQQTRQTTPPPHHPSLPQPSKWSPDRYTSLGEMGDTAKNEALRLPDGSYRPAYELAAEEEHLERSPRTPTNSPRSPPRDRGVGGRRESGGDDEGGEKIERFSSWDKKWESLDARDVGAAATAAASGRADGVASTSSTGIGTGTVPAGACATSKALELGSTNKPCLQPDGKVRSGGWRGLAGLVGWLPVTTVALALVLAAVGLRSSSGPSRGAAHDGAPEKGD